MFFIRRAQRHGRGAGRRARLHFRGGGRARPVPADAAARHDRPGAPARSPAALHRLPVGLRCPRAIQAGAVAAPGAGDRHEDRHVPAGGAGRLGAQRGHRPHRRPLAWPHGGPRHRDRRRGRGGVSGRSGGWRHALSQHRDLGRPLCEVHRRSRHPR